MPKSKGSAKKAAARKPVTTATRVPEQAPEVIHVPKPARSSFNPNRPIAKNLLIQAQLQHFHEVDRQLPEQHKTNLAPHKIKTEAEASEYIRQVTARLHEMHKPKAGKAT